MTISCPYIPKEILTALNNLMHGNDRHNPIENPRSQSEDLRQFTKQECKTAKILLESLILKRNAQRAFADRMKEVK